ncbi:MAG: NAD(P)-dependent oxidoreductase [Glaciimonas sp.]|nr:NAD(P)-dependent oxidoreductase [Glaciimonas sp.]
MNRILVTGGTGFVGAHVVRQLVAQGREVAVLMRASSNSRRIDDLLGRCTVIRGELANLESARGALTHFAPEAVVHLAWEGVKGVDRNSSVQIDNVVASINLYQLTEQIGCGYFLGLGSQAEYGPLAGRISESAATRPTTAYGAAKLATGLVLERTSVASGRPFAWLRLFSTYGPDDDPSWLIPYLIRSLLAGEKPSLTKAEQIWDYMHVNDAAAGVVAALDAGACGLFNLGAGRARPLRDIIAMIRDAINPSLPLGFGEVPYRSDQVMHLEADITALSSAAGWSPVVSLESGLVETVAWHQKEKLNAN